MMPVNTRKRPTKILQQVIIVVLAGATLSACVTSRVEHIKEAETGVAEGEAETFLNRHRCQFVHGDIEESLYLTGVKLDGTIVAREVESVMGTGGYYGSGGVIALRVDALACGPYRIPNVKIDNIIV